jgi:hypothetical protein
LNRRAAYIKESFKNIINNCIGIDEERKKPILDLFCFKRKSKKLFNDDFFFNDINYTYGFFEPCLTPFLTPKKDFNEEENSESEKSLTITNVKNSCSEWSDDSESEILKKLISNHLYKKNIIEEENKNKFFEKREKENNLNLKKIKAKNAKFNFDISISSFDSNL